MVRAAALIYFGARATRSGAGRRVGRQARDHEFAGAPVQHVSASVCRKSVIREKTVGRLRIRFRVRLLHKALAASLEPF